MIITSKVTRKENKDSSWAGQEGESTIWAPTTHTTCSYFCKISEPGAEFLWIYKRIHWPGGRR